MMSLTAGLVVVVWHTLTVNLQDGLYTNKYFSF